ncbi:MAG TPA: LppP/LprE family lipoprotein [Solirubrobacteraceae bacterium]|nr:LppP/LprE family lipoprotein [Solirubrobacteraceae bacterium]
MRRRRPRRALARRAALRWWTPALTAATSALLVGCGGATKTVSVSNSAQTPTNTTQTTASARSTPAARPTTTPTTTSGSQTSTTAAGGTAPGAAESSTTRTAPEPAFTGHGSGTSASGEATGSETAAAVATVKAHGYTPNDTSEYHPHQTLQVLLGTRTGSADGYDQRAFFFEDGKYIGTDSSQPSASMRVVSQGETEVAIAYSLYRAHDALCCPSGGQTTVHFQLDDGQLTPLQPIPPAQSATGLSRQ